MNQFPVRGVDVVSFNVTDRKKGLTYCYFEGRWGVACNYSEGSPDKFSFRLKDGRHGTGHPIDEAVWIVTSGVVPTE